MKKNQQTRNSPVSVTVRNFQKKLPVSVDSIAKIVNGVFLFERFQGGGHINVVVADDKKIRKLNAQFAGNNEPTDVLAFDISDSKKIILGDIIVSADTAVRVARRLRLSGSSELYLYVAHGLLHLLGYSDRTPKARKKMNNRARFILRKLELFA